jgi:chemotaxis protein methyltransferase CheR
MPAELCLPRTVPPALLARVAERLAQHAGLHFPPQRGTDLARAIAAAGAELHADDPGAWLDRLQAATLSARELDALVCHATVGETYFFRDPALFDTLRDLLLAELLRTSGEPQRPLRIWSAGCCTGEEAYSIAMWCERVLPAAWREQVSVIASDINPRSLAHAERGVYGAWSFRAAPAWVKHFFTRCRDGRFRIDSRLREQVRFFALNLAQEPYPPLPGGDGTVDIVICRNVLMYFEPRKAKEAVLRLRQRLGEGGWLFVSPAEMSNATFPGFETVAFAGALGYRRTERVRKPANAGAASASPSMVLPVRAAQEPEAGQPTPRARAQESESAAQAARRLADEGKLGAALECCDRAIAADRLNEALHYMRAVILRERGESEAAAAALQRALYLDPEFIMAHFTLGHLRVVQSRMQEALRHFAAAYGYAARLRPEQSIAYSEGVNAAHFMQLVGSVRISLAGSAGGEGWR